MNGELEQITGVLEETLVAPLDCDGLGSVAERIAQAALKVGAVEKRGRNDYFKYDYATAEDIKRAAREALAEAGVAIFPLMQKIEQRGDITRVRFDFVVSCPEGYITVPWWADGQDKADKGISKCATGALKSFLISLLQIPTGEDDPDSDAPQEKPTPAQKARQRAKRTVRDDSGKIPRPFTAKMVREALHVKCKSDDDTEASPQQVQFLARKFQEAFAGDVGQYHTALNWLWDVESAKELTKARASATLDWLLAKDGPDETGDTPLHEAAPEEAQRVLRQALKDAGQADMFEEAA